jgi:tetratricopeptide (TPR) repeat protein
LEHNIIILTIATFLTVSCNSHSEKKYDKEVIELNNRAIELMISNPDSALIILDKATEIDETYYVAYSNKVNIYISNGNFDQAIHSAKKEVHAKPDLAEAVTMLGMLYDYTGQIDKAGEQYDKAIDLYNNRLTTSDKHKQANRLNRAHTLLLLGKGAEGQNEIQQLLKENPDDFAIQMLVDFDKDKYLNDLFGQRKK